MDAEALVGKQAGSSTLDRVIGNGTLGAVYLGQQAQPEREVAVKVFLRLASLEPEQQRAFLETFRDEMAHVFALDHPHILPIYDYGTVDGLAYIVMPWIVGETLEETLTREGALPLNVVANCLQQIAAALDYAHGQGIVHRDLKPANVFLTPEEKVWVTDFHLTAMLVEGNTAHMRLSRAGLLDYMSPELIVGKHIDRRTDLYSLGALTYRMVTGVPPFQGQTLMKVATKHLKMPPPSPRAARPDLPPAAEQVILKALAKDPALRFDTAQDMALLFQQAINHATAPRVLSKPITPLHRAGVRLIASDPRASGYTASSLMASGTVASGGNSSSGPIASGNMTPGNSSSGSIAFDNPTTGPIKRDNSVQVNAVGDYPVPGGAESVDTGARSFVPPPLFGPSWRTNALPALIAEQNNESSGAINLAQASNSFELASSSSTSLPSLASFDPFAMQNGSLSLSTGHPQGASTLSMSTGRPQGASLHIQRLALPQGAIQANPLTPADQAPAQETPGPGQITWGFPQIKQEESGTTGTYKLTGPARIVSIPVAGQPGRYMTGILPTSPQSAGTAALPAPASPLQHPLLRRMRLPILVLAALLIVGGSLDFAFTHFSSSKQQGGSPITSAGTHNFSATATEQAEATEDANVIYSDSLAQNIRGWPEASSGSFLYQFKDGAYHITNNDSSRVAIAILPGENLNRPFVYTLTMDEIRGNDASVNNEAGMILRFTSQAKNGKQIITFYTFEVVNTKGGQYQFWKYDNSQGSSVSPWKQIATRAFGSEFRQGQGTGHSNTFKILVNGKNFTLIVNGKQVWTVHDSTLTDGQVGMLVNLKGTEVAFSNLLLTWS